MFLTLDALRGLEMADTQGRCATVTLVSLRLDGNPFEVSPELNYKNNPNFPRVSQGLAS